MENLALTTLLLPFIGALVVSFSPQRRAAEWGVLFAALTTLCMLSLISAFYQADKVAVTLTLVNVGDVALFGLVIDRVSTLILFVVVFLGLLVTIYSTGYLTDKNREHPHNGTNRYYAFLLVFIGAMAGLVLSSTLLGQLLFFEITGGCSWALISYYQCHDHANAANHMRDIAAVDNSAGKNVNAHFHHRCGVEIGADRCWRFHCVR